MAVVHHQEKWMWHCDKCDAENAQYSEAVSPSRWGQIDVTAYGHDRVVLCGSCIEEFQTMFRIWLKEAP